MKLLIVDDNDKISEMLKQTFASFFSDIKICSDGIIAVEEYKKFMPDWVFMDIKMREMDGLKAAKKIKINNPLAKIIIVTSYDNDSFRKEAKNSGAIDYVLKDELHKIFEIICVN